MKNLNFNYYEQDGQNQWKLSPARANEETDETSLEDRLGAEFALSDAYLTQLQKNIDEALDRRDEEAFMRLSAEYKELIK